MDTTTILIIIIVVLILFGGGWYGRGRWFLGRSSGGRVPLRIPLTASSRC
jgi:hypothetical protein